MTTSLTPDRPAQVDDRPTSSDPATFDDVYATIAAGAVERERSRTLAHSEVALLWERRFGALRLPVDRGGAGASVRDLFSELIALAAADSNITQALRVHFAFVEDQLIAGDDRRIAAIADGILVGNAITEPGSGAIGGYHTRLTRSADEWRLNGEKFYSTGSLYADHILVAADRDGERVSVLVPSTREGVERIDDWRGFGQRLTASGTTLFTDVVVHDDEILGPGYGTAGPTYATAYLQLFQLAGLAGIAQRATDDLVQWVSARERTFTHSVADRQRDDPLVQEIVGHLSATAFSARSSVLAVADLLDDLLATDPENAEAITRVELAAGRAQASVAAQVLAATNELFEVGGASIVAEETALDRHWRNARVLAVHNPINQKLRAIGDHLLNGTDLPYAWSAGVRNSAAPTGQ
ncbi:MULTISPECIES: acyl-CoA dehydrogenase family protein [Gordonia]|uniref:acyl-CoA dehydrogenase family protein n=2 Tax=Gordoniaceae TaxID=85026 RepID=UPI0007EAEE16|nr:MULTISPECIES: acyl-CoA dehydrogenase family protein [Gordonia]MCM3898051.1 acyl-CoA dehydrogenase family protein [Gordonia sputi]OBA60410.1 acyl-CoA dehydrogenase [Gordonia sp. 852002-10350_SCH5691597]